ncbi:MAG: MerR family transcriptional regulator [Armatimonadota bacterium]
MEGPIFYLIKEVSELTGVNPHTIRYWEKSFTEFLRPKRSGDKNKQRLYSTDDIEMIKRIKHVVQSEKNSIDKARRILQAEELSLPEEGISPGKRGDDMAVTTQAQTPSRIIKGILDEIKNLKDEYKNDFETVYEGLNLIIEQTTPSKNGGEVKEIKEQIEHLEALMRQSLKSSVAAEAEKQDLLQSLEDLKFKQLKDSEEKSKIIQDLKETVMSGNKTFKRILWIAGIGIISIASAVMVVLNWIR